MALHNTLLFDGSTDYLDAGNDASLQISGVISISAWVRPSATDSGLILSKHNASTANGGFILQAGATVANKFTFAPRINGSQVVLTGTSSFTLDQWYHVAATYDGSNLRIYVDGVLDGTTASAGSLTANTLNTCQIGRNADNGANHFSGSMASVKVLDIVLSDSQIRELYNDGTPKVHRAYSATIRDNTVLSVEAAEDLPTTLEQSDFDALTNNQFHITDGNLTDLSSNALTVNNSGTTKAVAGLNNKDVIDFDGASHFTVGAITDFVFLHLSQGKSVFVVLEIDSAADGQAIVSTSFGSSGQTGFDLWLNPTSNQHRILIGDGVPAAPLDYIAASSSMTSRWMIVEFSGSTNATNLIYENNGSISNTGTNPGGEDTGNPLNILNIGRYSNASGNFNGRIADIVLFDAEQTGANKESVLNRITAKYFPLRDSSLERNTIVENGTPTLTGATLEFSEVPTYALNAALLNGTSQYFDAGDVLDGGTVDISQVCWFKTTSAATQQIIRKGISVFYNLYIEGGALISRLFVAGGNQRVRLTDSSAFNDGNWHQVISFIDRSAGTIVIYVDGVLEASSEVSGAGVITGNIDNADSLIIGASSAITLFFDGELAFPMISMGSDLTADATELYNGGIPLCYDDLAPATQSKITGFWNLANWSGSYGQETYDQTGTGNSLTNVGTTPHTGSGLPIECTNGYQLAGPDGLVSRDLLIHADGTLIDEGVNTLTLTPNNGVVSDTSLQVYGIGSISFPNATSYLTAPYNAAWNFANGDWTVDLWVRFSALSARSILATHGYDSSVNGRNWNISYDDSANNLELYQSTTGSDNFGTLLPWTPAVDQWYHILWSRSGSTIYAFVNGQLLGTGTVRSLFVGVTKVLSIGKDSDGTEDLDGYIDELRILKGTGVAADFAPPSKPYGFEGTVSLVGPSAETSVASGSLSVPEVFLSGTSIESSLAVATPFLPEVFIAGSSVETSAASAQLSVEVLILGNSIESSAASATIGVIEFLQGNAVETSQASAFLRIQHFVTVVQQMQLDSLDAGTPVTNQLTLVPLALGQETFVGSNDLTLDQMADWSINAVQVVQESVNLSQKSALFATNGSGQVVFIIDEDGNVSTLCEAITPSDFVIGGIILPTPEFPDTQISDNNVTESLSRAGVFLQTANEFLSQATEYQFIFRDITETQKNALQALFLSDLGEPVAVTDHRSDTYNAVVLNPETEFSESRPDACNEDRFDVTIRLVEVP